MRTWLSDREQASSRAAHKAASRQPDSDPDRLPRRYRRHQQSATQKRVEAADHELGGDDLNGQAAGLTSPAVPAPLWHGGGVPARNDVYGNVLQVAPDEAREPEMMLAAQRSPAKLIFDVPTISCATISTKELVDLGRVASQTGTKRRRRASLLARLTSSITM